MTTHLLSPMLVQYLVGLCCLKWNPDSVDVTIGNMVYDEGSQKNRDVDVTVTIKEHGQITHAFMAYEVKHENKPLDVVTIEQLCMKLGDMPNLTHRAIVSSSGFTAGAQTKAAHHKIELYVLKQWTRPLKEQFPQLGMDGTAEECFPSRKTLLCWPKRDFFLVAKDAKKAFHVKNDDGLFNAKGKPHRQYKTYGLYTEELMLRSTEILCSLEPALSVARIFPIPFVIPEGEIPSSPAWPHTHTLDVTSDDVYVETGEGKCKLNQVTISGMLHWEYYQNALHYYVIERIHDGEALAGAMVSTNHREGQMTCLIFSPKTHEIGIEFVQLAERHHNAIRNLKLNIRDSKNEG